MQELDTPSGGAPTPTDRCECGKTLGEHGVATAIANHYFRAAPAVPEAGDAMTWRDRAERAEAALAEAAREINCAGSVAHRIRVLKKEWSEEIREVDADARLGAALREALAEVTRGEQLEFYRAAAGPDRIIVSHSMLFELDAETAATRALAALLRAPARDATGGGV
jgi:hypothetical protein